MPARFYIWREECWGGAQLWRICDHEHWRKTHRRLPDRIKTVRRAERICDRMNADWDAFLKKAEFAQSCGPPTREHWTTELARAAGHD